MAVLLTVSTDGKFKVFSSTNATLGTAISEVINALEDHHVSNSLTSFQLTHDGTNFVYMATVGRLK